MPGDTEEAGYPTGAADGAANGLQPFAACGKSRNVDDGDGRHEASASGLVIPAT